MEERSDYITYDSEWSAKPCPQCNQRVASAHGWLFKEPPPTSPTIDTRKPIGEVFIHDEGNDCVILAESERPQGN
jgi:hypothetical protein